MVERMVPLYEDAVKVRDTDIAGLDHASKLAVIKGKVGAKELLANLTPVLFPEDDDG